MKYLQNGLRYATFLGLFAVACWTAFPLGYYEADGSTVAVGASYADGEGWGWDEHLRMFNAKSVIYRFHSQAGTYAAIVALNDLLDVSYYAAFGYLSFLGGLVWILGSACLLKRMTGASLLLAIVVMALVPDGFLLGTYPNSNAMAAGWLGMCAILVASSLTPTRAVAFAVSFAVAVWCRADAMLMAPAFALATVATTEKAVWRLGTAGLVGGVSLGLLCLVSEFDLSALVGSRNHHNSVWSSWTFTLQNYRAFLSVTVLLLLVYGMFQCVKRKEWLVAMLPLAGCLPLAIAYGNAVTTPKYFAYMAPFMVAPIVLGLRVSDWSPRNRLRTALPLALIAVFGFLEYLPVKGWARASIVDTHDGQRPLWGRAYLPAMIRFEKDYYEWEVRELRDRIGVLLDRENADYVAIADNQRLANGYLGQMNGQGRELCWRGNTVSGRLLETCDGTGLEVLVFWNGGFEMEPEHMTLAEGERFVYAKYLNSGPELPPEWNPKESDLSFGRLILGTARYQAKSNPGGEGRP